VASQYDPPGLLAPLFLDAKLLIQELWMANIGWDEPLQKPFAERWTQITKKWKGPEIRLPRYTGDSSPAKMYQLHIYSDASKNAYSCACYLRVELENGNVLSNLIFSKLRIRPIPKLKKKKSNAKAKTE